MADSKDSLKRDNYFTLKRDEIMAMDEYLLSPISEIDLRKMNEGGIATIEDLTKPIGMSFGGSVDELGTLIKKLELQQILPLDLIDKMEDMNSSEIDNLHNKYIGSK